MKKFLSALGITALSLAAVAGLAGSSAQAADFMAPLDDSGTVTINSSESHHNLYVAGGDISINSVTTGDLYAAGGWVSIDGPVEQDVVVAGGTVVISEPVNGDVRVAGGKVTINAPVKGDVLAGAGTLVLTDKSSVGGELRVSGGNVVVNGPVSGGAYFMGGKITLNSKIDGMVKVTATQELVLGSSADIASEVSYIGKQNAVVNDGAKVNVAFTEMEQHQRDRGERTGFVGFLLGSFIIQFFALVLAALLCLRLFRRPTTVVVETMFRRPWASLGIGFVTAVITPIAIVIAFIVIVGYYIALVAAAAYVLAALASVILSAIFLGAWVAKLLNKKPHLVFDWQSVVIGSASYILLKYIPVIGWAIDAAIFLVAFGALATVFRSYLKRSGSAPTEPTVSN